MQIAEEVKECSGCKGNKPLSDFVNDRTKPTGKSSRCKICLKEYRDKNSEIRKKYFRDWYAVNKEQERLKRITRLFNISEEEYFALLRSQEFSCAICGVKEEELSSSLNIDHDHSCCVDYKRSCGDCIRGLLCVNCNTALGLVKDNIGTLKAMVSYLEEGSCK